MSFRVSISNHETGEKSRKEFIPWKQDRSHSTWVNGSAGSKGLDLQDSSLCFQEQKDSGHSVETEGSSSGARSSPEGLSQETRFSHWLSGQASGRSSKRIKPKLWRHWKNRENYILKCNLLPLHNTLLLVPVAMKFIILPFRALLKKILLSTLTFVTLMLARIHVLGHTHLRTEVKHSLWELVLSFPRVGPRNWSQIVRFVNKYLYHGAVSPALAFKHEAYVCTHTHVHTLTTCVLVPEGARQGHHIFCSWSCR